MSARANTTAAGEQVNKGRPSSSGGRWAFTMVLFSTTIFVSASLLFLVEPMFAKFVLPSFGGTPAVWTGSMMFFQAALLIGYLYVHLSTTRLGSRKQAVLHLAVVLAPVIVLPLAVPEESWAPGAGANPLLSLLVLLFVALGLPFFAISTTNPLIQRWLAETDHPAASDPYFLYRASNLGSILGLLGYPLLVERTLGLGTQGLWWSMSYAVLVVLVFACAVVLWRSPRPAVEPETVQEEAGPVTAGSSALEVPQEEDPASPGALTGRVTMWRRLRWVALAFVPSSFMLGVTAFVTTNITPIPLLWVIPLSLYLFSFVVVSSPGTRRVPDVLHKAFVAIMPLTMALLTVTMLIEMRNPYWLLILVHIFGFFVSAMVCHGELFRDRPPANHLTEFYLWVAVGGVLGGIFNALIAPVVFDAVWEYPLIIVATCLFLPAAVLARLLRRDDDVGQEEGGEEASGSGRSTPAWLPRALDVALPLALGIFVWLVGGYAIDAVVNPELFGGEGVRYAFQFLVGLAAAVCLWFAYASIRPLRFGLGIAALIIAGTAAAGSSLLYEDRSFFGVYQVTGDEPGLGYHALVVGDTNHGAQILGVNPPIPIAYHDPSGPFGQLFNDGALPTDTADEDDVAVLGLGTGSMFCYSSPGQQWDFYEIDPTVESIARDTDMFTFLRDCAGDSEVILGDARLQLAEAEDGQYGMIVGEAFSSDAIPVHLMTREAMQMYFDKLDENGVLVMHISNRHLELEPVLGDLAADLDLTCYGQYDGAIEDVPYKLASHFVVMSRAESDLGGVPNDPRWQQCETDPDADVWTDDYSNLLSTFNWS